MEFAHTWNGRRAGEDNGETGAGAAAGAGTLSTGRTLADVEKTQVVK